MNQYLNFTAGHRTTRFPRRGSTLIVVLALLALLSMLGLALVVFSGSEKRSAENFSAGVEREMRSQPRPSGDVLSQFAISRLALGGLSTEPNSALYGGRHSLVPSLVGRDLYPHNGRGINVITDPAGSVRTDQDYDGIPDPLSQRNLEISDSPFNLEDINGNARLDQGEDLNNNGYLDFPNLTRTDPDVGFTAPDINSVFLSFSGYIPNNDNDQLVHAFTPSFSRPQYRRQLVSGNASWEIHPFTVRHVLRPHPWRYDFNPPETDANNNGQLDPNEDLNLNGQLDGKVLSRGFRYVRTLQEAQRLGLSGPFPFNAAEDLNGNDVLDPGEDQNQNGVLDYGSRMGVWDIRKLLPNTFYRAGECVRIDNAYYRVLQSGNSGQNGTALVKRQEQILQPRYQLDADPDGDGVKEAVWLDLDFPIQSLGDGRKAVPLFAFTIVDADGLINFNTAGNTSGFINLQSTRSGQVFGSEDLNEDVNGNGQLDPGEDVNGNGQLDSRDGQLYRGEDTNGNGRLDPKEDRNGNSQLDPGEDRNNNGILDPTEDLDNNGILDPGEDRNLNGQLDHSISRSNLGMAPSEINPLWALDAGSQPNDPPSDRNPLEIFSDQKIFFSHAPQTPQENANMEWWFALKGRPITDIGSGNLLGFLPGRHGDIQRLIQAANAGSNNPLDFPQPGIPLNGLSVQDVLNADDNWNAYEGHGYGQYSPLTPVPLFPLGQRGARRIPFGHPLDFRGSGTLHHLHLNGQWHPLLYESSTSTTPVGRLMPSYWPRYWGFHALANLNPTIRWGRGLQSGITSGPLGRLMPNTPTNQLPLVDEQEESIVDSRYRSSDDSLFDTEENFFLQGSERDLEATGVNSRLGSLLSYNLSINNRAKEIRKRFTVNSWDTRNATRPKYPFTGIVQTGRNRFWEFDTIQPTPDPNGMSIPQPQQPPVVWFPPCYDGFSGNPSKNNNGPSYDPKDPFRPAVRRLLQQTNNAFDYFREDPTHTLRRLSLNHIAVLDLNGQPIYRELGEHPVHEDLNENGQLDNEEDLNGNGVLDSGEDNNNNGILDPAEDLNNNGILDLFRETALPREWTGYQLDAGQLPNTNNVTLTPQMEQEFRARVDRQRMARDIYVLLYMFCGGQDNVFYHTKSNAGREVYTEEQLREMAQFAVNLVDSLDRDQVITKFEYDKDLSNGWLSNSSVPAPDDNPFNGDEDNQYGSGHQRYNYRYPEDGPERGVVYGVEAQQLTLSEFLAIRSKKVLNDAGNAGEDHPATAHNDTEDRHYAYIELHNADPRKVWVGGGHWQIILQPRTIKLNPTQQELANDVRKVILWDNRTPILPGHKFTIGSAADGHTKNPVAPDTIARYSEFTVDEDFTTDPMYQLNVARVAPSPSQTTNNWLDLIREHGKLQGLHNKERFRITDGLGTDKTATAGELLAGVPFLPLPTADLDLRIVLRRRLHTRRRGDPTLDADKPSTNSTTNSTLEDNPWVEVDSMIYRMDKQPSTVMAANDTGSSDWEFTIKNSHNDYMLPAADPERHRIKNELKRLRSRQRVQPFDARTTAGTDDFTFTPRGGQAQPYWPNNSLNLPLTHITNSLGAPNVLEPTDPTASPLWQNHPDRDFASIGELLSIPLSAPWEITNSDMTSHIANSQGVFRGLNLSSNRLLTHTAGYKKFLRTRGTPITGVPQAQVDNRWYRLFSFANILTRTDHFPSAQLPNQKKFRVPGRINLNTVRHPEVLAALLDEPQLLGLTGQAFMVDTLGVNRWTQFLESRNGLDPISNLFLPGTATSRPFRDFGFIYRGEKSIEDTLFRSLPAAVKADPTNGWIDGRRLFGLGTDQTNSLSRLRLLSKIAGNTTTRSNVFHVFLQVSWFEAYQNPLNGNVQIGAPLKDATSHRAFFVLDRSRILEHLKPTHLSINPGDLSVGTGTNGGIELDPSTIILHSQVIE